MGERVVVNLVVLEVDETVLEGAPEPSGLSKKYHITINISLQRQQESP